MSNTVEEKIAEYKKQKKALILAHYYQPPQIQALADFTGDSFELSRKAKEADAETILFCGVYFMAESAKILSPHKTVLIPNKSAGCPMADMIGPEDIKALRSRHKEAAVVTYINSSAAVKAESDICCTSANAVKVVNSLPNEEIIFLPDQNLGSYIARFTDKKIILYSGYCPTHHKISPQSVIKARAKHPGVPVLVHPECPAGVVDLADFTGSTAKIIDYATASDQMEFIIGTEEGILYPLQQKNPGKTFYMLQEEFICPDMKKISPDDVLSSLIEEKHAVDLEEDVIRKASASLLRMLAV